MEIIINYTTKTMFHKEQTSDLKMFDIISSFKNNLGIFM